jgi:gliding motility-associated-like protein
VTASVNKNSICSGTEVVFTAAAKEAGPFPAYHWFLNGSPATTGPVYRSAALHDGDAVYCRVTPAQSACPNHAAISDTIRAVVYPLPVLRIIPADTLISIGSCVHFTTVITGTVARYTWNPLPQLQAPVSLQPTTIALNDQTEFSLLVETEKGCKATAKAVVRIIKHLYMPNAFTPNGDGRNDHFRIPPGVKLKLELFSVYDRWGNRVFSTRAIEKGWNGTWKGMPLSTGNYVYVITGSDEKGMVLLKGNVLLVR